MYNNLSKKTQFLAILLALSLSVSCSLSDLNPFSETKEAYDDAVELWTLSMVAGAMTLGSIGSAGNCGYFAGGMTLPTELHQGLGGSVMPVHGQTEMVVHIISSMNQGAKLTYSEANSTSAPTAFPHSDTFCAIDANTSYGFGGTSFDEYFNDCTGDAGPGEVCIELTDVNILPFSVVISTGGNSVEFSVQ